MIRFPMIFIENRNCSRSGVSKISAFWRYVVFLGVPRVPPGPPPALQFRFSVLPRRLPPGSLHPVIAFDTVEGRKTGASTFSQKDVRKPPKPMISGAS